MAQSIMQHIVSAAGKDDEFLIDSAATDTDEIGNGVYPQTRQKLTEKGIPTVEHRARLMVPSDGLTWDYIALMDDENVRHSRRILGSHPEASVFKLMGVTDKRFGATNDERLTNLGSGYVMTDARDVADPWYTRDFESTYQDLIAACTTLFEMLTDVPAE